MFVPRPSESIPESRQPLWSVFYCQGSSWNSQGWRERRPHGDTLLLIHQFTVLWERKQGLCAVNTLPHDTKTEITRAQPGIRTDRDGYHAGCGFGVYVLEGKTVRRLPWSSLGAPDCWGRKFWCVLHIQHESHLSCDQTNAGFEHFNTNWLGPNAPGTCIRGSVLVRFGISRGIKIDSCRLLSQQDSTIRAFPLWCETPAFTSALHGR